jgi:hypothetical protein
MSNIHGEKIETFECSVEMVPTILSTLKLFFSRSTIIINDTIRDDYTLNIKY